VQRRPQLAPRGSASQLPTQRASLRFIAPAVVVVRPWQRVEKKKPFRRARETLGQGGEESENSRESFSLTILAERPNNERQKEFTRMYILTDADGLSALSLDVLPFVAAP